jgi:peptidoglycan/LPS O-acetylase OafA/YrhL
MRFRVLDAWRGVAALLVALFHLNLFSVVYSLDFVRNAFLFVDFFFVLSGFVITHSYADRLATLEGVGVFAARRFSRLWPLHVVVLLAFVMVELAKSLAASHGASFNMPSFTEATSPASLPLHLVFAQSFGIVNHLTWNPPSWSIAAEFWTYLIFAAALYPGATRLPRIRFAAEAILVALLAASVAILVACSDRGQDVTYDLGLFRCLYGFLVGHFVYRLWRICPRELFETRLLEIAVLFIAVYYVSTAGRSGYGFCAPLVFAGLVLVFAFEAGPVSRLMSNRANDWLGRISYSIYMWQAFIIFNLVDRPISVIEKITHKALTVSDNAGSALGGEAGKLIMLGGHVLPILATLLFLGVLVAVASVSYLLIERPGQDWLRIVRWTGRKPEDAAAHAV